MPATPPNVIFLTGAPVASTLLWDADDPVSTLERRVGRYLNPDGESNSTQLESTCSSSFTLAKWRRLPLENLPRRPTIPPRITPSYSVPLASFHEAPGSEQDHLDFLEHSLAILQNLDSSQIEPPDDDGGDDTIPDHEATSFNSAISSTASSSPNPSALPPLLPPPPPHLPLPPTGPITDLKRIPPAQHLLTIHPQTITINIIAAIITIQPPRTIHLRKRPAAMDMIEVLVGDDTRAGFNISFWLAPTTVESPEPARRSAGGGGGGGGRGGAPADARATLRGLRPGDVVLVTYLALAHFNGNVFGQSLSRRITRNNTELVACTEERTGGLVGPVGAKVERVRRWAGAFVGNRHQRPVASPTDPTFKKRKKSLLPPDTQPGEG